MPVTLQQAKAHLRVDFDDENGLIDGLINAAQDWLEGVGVAEVDLDRPAISHAALLMIGHWYEHRTAVSEADLRQVPMAVMALIAPWREVLT